MAKTKTVKAWGVFTRKGKLQESGGFWVYRLKTDAESLGSDLCDETVRPVTVVWKVEE